MTEQDALMGIFQRLGKIVYSINNGDYSYVEADLLNCGISATFVNGQCIALENL